MKRMLISAMAFVALAAPASGAVLHSAPASSGFTDDYLICQLRNLSSKPVQAAFDFLDFSGSVVGGTGGSDYTVPPGEMQTVTANPIPAAASCRITVSTSARNVRGSAAYLDPAANQVRIVLPAE